MSGGVHVPQLSALPQPSPTSPQFAPSDVHVLGVHGGTPHTFAVPPPPHVALPVHVPQTAVSPPQPSATCPQFAPRDAHVAGVQAGAPHTPGVPPPPHVAGGVQVPQLIVPPHPSPVRPHVTPAGHVWGTQAFPSDSPHAPGTPPPPHVAGGVHVPHTGVRPPHPFPVCPHVMLGGQGSGVQPLTHAPPMHDPVEQVPHEIAPPQPFGQSPQVTPVGHFVMGVHVAHIPSTHSAPPSHVPQLMRPPSPQPFGYSPHEPGWHVAGVHTGDGVGRFVSDEGHDARSSSMYSSAFSCGVSAPVAQPDGTIGVSP